MAHLSARELDSLTRAISGPLRAVVPKEAAPRIDADVWWRLDQLVNQPGSLEDNLLVASLSILSHVQDEIIRDLAEGWPRSVDGRPGERDPGEDLPGPNAAVNSGMLRLWYGDAQRPALELPPVRLAGLDPTLSRSRQERRR